MSVATRLSGVKFAIAPHPTATVSLHWVLPLQQHRRGALQNKLLRDVEQIQLLTTNIFQFLPSAVLTILVAIEVTAVRAPWFLIFFLRTVPAAVILVQVLKRPIYIRNQAFRQQLEGMSARLVEMSKLIPVTRAHGAETTEIERIERRLTAV
ncbi:MAG: ABC transporter ATP-binding protein [Microcoleus sp. SIO2G3]|nr:ABC transporter ATP-binding protein [Microcoleus sp. SIO2G3]